MSSLETNQLHAWRLWVQSVLTPKRAVWGVWLLLSINLIRYVALISHPIPMWDDWAFVPHITGDAPVTAEWLWAPHNDHRMPIAKLMLLVMVPMFDGDFRTEVFFNLATMIAAAAGLLYVAGRVRGKLEYTDAFFPLALLHCGYVDFYIGIGTITHAIAIVAGLGLLGVILVSRELPTRSQVLLAGLCLITIPLSAATTLPLVPAGILWLGMTGFQKYRSSGSFKEGSLDWSVAFVAAILLVLYFVDFRGADGQSRPSTLHQIIHISAQAATMTVLPAQWMQQHWPYIFFLIPVTGAIAIYRLAHESLRHTSPQRIKAIGTLLFLLAAFVPALAIGWSRGFIGPLAGTATRYGYYLFPIAAAIYLAFVAFEQNKSSRVVPIALCLFAIIGLRSNFKHTYTTAMVYYDSRVEFTKDVEAGASLDELARKYSGHSAGKFVGDEHVLAAGIRGMRRRDFGIFGRIRDSNDQGTEPEQHQAAVGLADEEVSLK